MAEVIQRNLFNQYDIVDISETSLALTRRMLEGIGDKPSVRFIHTDFLQYKTDKRYDVISCSEVLEHVETPERFLSKSRELLADQGRLYITTCVNAPVIDHIYLFSSVQEIEELFDNAGLRIVDKLYVPYKGTTLERCVRQKLPVNVAYILQKA